MKSYLMNLWNALCGYRPIFGAEQGFEVFGGIDMNKLNGDAQEAINTAICDTLKLCGVENQQSKQYASMIKAADEEIEQVNTDLEALHRETDQKIHKHKGIIAKLNTMRDKEETEAGETIEEIEAQRSKTQRIFDFVTS